MDWQDHLRNAMEKNKPPWRLADLAKGTGMDRDKLQRWMRTNRNGGEPTISAAVLIAEAMGKSLDEVFRGQIPDDEIEQILRQSIAQVQAVVHAGSQAQAGGKD